MMAPIIGALPRQRAADDDHRQGEDDQPEADVQRADGAPHQDVDHSGATAQRPADEEGDQPVAAHPDAQRGRELGVVADRVDPSTVLPSSLNATSSSATIVIVNMCPMVKSVITP